ncbi:uncharacterized protein PHACADRAFT_266573, partial [Phanerochaete carnosa HHB-10118-sp]
SHTWSRRFRPRLFAQLELKTEGDDRTLYGIVRSPLSAWLAEHIAVLRFSRIGPRGYPLWTALLRLLPACRNISHDFGGKPVRMLLSHSPGLKSSLQSITSLSLYNCTFPSFRTLLRILADITYLKNVYFTEAASNVCTGAFSHVCSVQMWSCTNNMAVPAWILAAASTRHSFTRRRAVGPETWAIIDLIQTFFKDDGKLGHSKFYIEEATAGELDWSLYQISVLTGWSKILTDLLVPWFSHTSQSGLSSLRLPPAPTRPGLSAKSFSLPQTK